MLGAVTFGHQSFQPVIEAIIELAETCAKEPWALPEPPANKARDRGAAARRGRTADRGRLSRARQAGAQRPARRRQARAVGAVRQRRRAGAGAEAVQGHREGDRARRDPARRNRGSTAATPRRCGRSICQVGILPRAHGSALFTRGETQALVVATLGTGQDEQIIDALEGEYRENFMLHYNFPPYSTGEAGRMGSPGRREIGHGKLAWRAVRPLLPPKESFPYTIRVVSEITEFERLVVDGHGLRRLAGADGCRRAAAAPGRRHRDGPDQGAGRLCRALRHPRRRGPSRRHGLQGRRHRARRHRAADGHQDHLDHRGDHARRARSGAATAGVTSSARWRRR